MEGLKRNGSMKVKNKVIKDGKYSGSILIASGE